MMSPSAPARGALFACIVIAAFGIAGASGAPVAPPVGAPTPDLPPRTKMALKIAGLVTFVANSCPHLAPDYARFRATVGALGVPVEELATEGMKSGYLGYAAQYQVDAKASCERARLEFGPKGATVPDLFAVR